MGIHLKRLIGFSVLIMALSAHGFSLMGPYAEWMQPLLSYRLPGDIGGPMNIGEEYRWNVPVITYGFDEDFINTFGQSGVNAVEEAIQVFNDLPPASEIDLNDYPTFVIAENAAAEAFRLTDLKSVTMSLLIEQLGLADPSRFVYTLRHVERTAEATNFTVIERNFAPSTLEATNIINSVGYSYNGFVKGSDPERYFPRIVQLSPEPNAGTVAGWLPESGRYLTGLSSDDAGGLRYLYNPDNRNQERLPEGAEGSGTNSSTYVDQAVRPGVNKLTFVRQELDPSTEQFAPFTNHFIDYFFADGVQTNQSVRRIVSSPDIVFSARDFGIQIYAGKDFRSYYLTPYERSDTSRWINSVGDGPGTIAPGVKITFQDMWKYYIAAGHRTMTDYQQTDYGYFDAGPFYHWASFTNSTNIVIHHSAQTNLSHLTLETRITETNSFFWAILANYNAVYDIQRSTNVTDWQTVQTFTNSYGMHVFLDTNLVPNAFYRAVRIQDGPVGP